MDNHSKRHILNNSSGQSTVEYVFLLGVIVLLVLSVIRSKAFKKYMGEEGEVLVAYKEYMECTYHMPMPCDRLGKNETGVMLLINKYQGNHPGYVNPSNSQQTRFFAPLRSYEDTP